MNIVESFRLNRRRFAVGAAGTAAGLLSIFEPRSVQEARAYQYCRSFTRLPELHKLSHREQFDM